MNRSHTARPVAKKSAEASAPALFGKHLFKSVAFTLAFGAVLLLLLSLIAYFDSDPNRLIRPLGIAAAALTAFAGSFFTVRIHRHSALVCGILNGGIVMAICMILSLFFKGRAVGYSAGVSCLLHIGFLLFSVAGASVGFPRHSSKKRRRHRS